MNLANVEAPREKPFNPALQVTCPDCGAFAGDLCEKSHKSHVARGRLNRWVWGQENIAPKLEAWKQELKDLQDGNE